MGELGTMLSRAGISLSAGSLHDLIGDFSWLLKENVINILSVHACKLQHFSVAKQSYFAELFATITSGCLSNSFNNKCKC